MPSESIGLPWYMRGSMLAYVSCWLPGGRLCPRPGLMFGGIEELIPVCGMFEESCPLRFEG